MELDIVNEISCEGENLEMACAVWVQKSDFAFFGTSRFRFFFFLQCSGPREQVKTRQQWRIPHDVGGSN